MHNKKMTWNFVTLLLLLACSLFAEQVAIGPSVSMVATSYYDYPNEKIQFLRTFDSELVMTKESLQKWDKLLDELAENHHIIEGGLYRLYAYLYTAQRDVAMLSYDTKGAFQGSLDPISLAIIRLFYPFFTPSFEITSDKYSYKLTDIVFANFKKRYLKENANIKKEGKLLHIYSWTGQFAEFGESTLGWTPWVISPIDTTAISPPLHSSEDKEAWEKQKAALQKFKRTHPHEHSLNIYWQQHKHPEIHNWLNLANQFLFSQDISFAKTLLCRSILAIALYDAIITNTKLKYIYETEKPHQKMGTPSLHATLAYTAASILSYYFPKQEKHWRAIADEAALAGVRGGLNYPLDVDVGRSLGEKISEEFTHD